MLELDDDILDIKGEILTLDPKSKILTSFLIIIGVSLSIEPFQVLIFLVLSIPILLTYRPSIHFLKKLALIIPLLLVFILISLAAFKSTVTVNLLWFSREYTPVQFTILLTFRLFVSALHTSILIESEPTVFNILEALQGFNISDFLLSILLLISRMAINIQEDYEKMLIVAKTRGGMQGNLIRQLFFRFQLLGRILSKNIGAADQLGDTLSARGFEGTFYSSSRNITSDGLTVFVVIAIFWSITLITPFLRGII